MQFTWDYIHYLEVRPYQNVKSIRQAIFKLPCSEAISRIGYNMNLQTAVKCEVNPTSGFQDIAFTSNCGRTDGQGHSIILLMGV